jgi:hypothetical protein|tara:strand:+ start:378 stop:608 length:231 start_codon:yes stop_codon:yes gene_type:complete
MLTLDEVLDDCDVKVIGINYPDEKAEQIFNDLGLYPNSNIFVVNNRWWKRRMLLTLNGEFDVSLPKKLCKSIYVAL